MGRWILVPLPEVVPHGDDLIFVDYHCSDGNFAHLGSAVREGQRLKHVPLVHSYVHHSVKEHREVTTPKRRAL